MGEEPINISSMCRSFDKLVELTRVTGRLNEAKDKYLLERCRMYEVRRKREKVDVYETKGTQ